MSFARRWLTTFSVLLGACVAGWWLYLQFLDGHENSANYLFNLVYAVPTLCAAFFLWSRAQLWRAQGHADADGMWLFAVSAAAQFVAQAIWTSQNFLGDSEPVISWPDLFYLISLACSAAALVSLLFHGKHNNPMARLMGTLAGTGLAVAIALVGSMATSGIVVPGSSLVSLDTFYMSAAFVLSALTLVALSRGRHEELRPFLIIVLVSVVLTGFGDALYALDSLADAYWNGGSADALYALSAIFYFWGCTRMLPDAFPSVVQSVSDEPPVLRRGYVLVPVGIILIGILLSSRVAEWSYRSGVTSLQTRLSIETSTKGELLTRLFEQEQSNASAYAAFFGGVTEVSDQQFKDFTAAIFSHNNSSADYSFVNNLGVVHVSTRAEFVGQPVSALGSWTSDIARVQTTGTTVISAPTLLLSGQTGVRIIAPVVRSGTMIGVVVSSVRLGDLLASYFLTFDRTLYSYELSSEGRYVESNGRALSYADGRAVNSDDSTSGAINQLVDTSRDGSALSERTIRVLVADREWILTIRPLEESLRSVSTSTLLLFLGMLLFCGALAAIAYTWLSMHVRMKRDLAEKTKSLQSKITELSQSKYFLDHVSEAVVIADEQWQIVYANRAATNLSIHSDHGLIGKRFWTHILTELDEQRTRVQEALETTGRFEGELQVVKRTGGSRDQWITVEPLPSDVELPRATMIVLRDITERKTIERAKSAFVSLVAHQLRTPMTQLRWMAETLLGGRLTKNIRETLEQMQGIILTENRLVSDLLNVSRIERGVLKFSTAVTPLSSVLSETIDPLVSIARQRKIEIMVRNAAPTVSVNVDSGKIVEAIRNIVDNAVKYTPDGGKVFVDVAMVDKNAEISISDQGAGVPEEIWETVFDIKYSPTVNATQNSTGLGLYLTKRFIESMGGKVRFTSTGNGAVFTVSLPTS